MTALNKVSQTRRYRPVVSAGRRPAPRGCGQFWRRDARDFRQPQYASVVALVAACGSGAAIRVKDPALYSPEGDGAEVLELDDDWLIDALEAVQAALSSAARPARQAGAQILRGHCRGFCLRGWGSVSPCAWNATQPLCCPRPRAMRLGQHFLSTCKQVAAQGGAVLRHARPRRARSVANGRCWTSPPRCRSCATCPPHGLHAFRVGYFVIDARLLDAAESAEALCRCLVAGRGRGRAVGDPVVPVLDHMGLFPRPLAC